MKKKFSICQALGAFFLVVLASGCARDRLAGFRGASNTNQHSGMPHQSETGGSVAMTQKLCPVTGEPLDSMGGAIPVNANGETVYVCCQGCVKAVNTNPEKYLATVRSES